MIVKMVILGLIAATIISFIITPVYTKIVRVTVPAYNSSFVCSGEKTCCLINDCHVLNAKIWSSSTLQVNFLNGEHILSKNILISNYSTIQFEGSYNSTPKIIICNFKIEFKRVAHLTISHVSFIESSQHANCFSLVHFKNIKVLAINHSVFVEDDNVTQLQSVCQQIITFEQVLSLVANSVSFMGCSNNEAYAKIYMHNVQAALFFNVVLLYTVSSFIGKNISIENSQSYSFKLEMCTLRNGDRVEVMVENSVLNNSLIGMCGDLDNCENTQLSCPEHEGSHFILKMNNSTLEGRKSEFSCYAIRFTLTENAAKLVIDLLNSTCIGNIYVDAIHNVASMVRIYLNQTKLHEINTNCTTGLEVTTLEASHSIINVWITSSNIVTGIRFRSLNSVMETVDFVVNKTNFSKGMYGIRLFDDLTYPNREANLYLTVVNSFFTDISRYAIVSNIPRHSCYVKMSFFNTVFTGNKGVLFIGRIEVQGWHRASDPQSYTNVSFSGCTLHGNGGELSASGVGHTITLISVNTFTFKDCTITGNNNSGLLAFLTDVTIEGHTEFSYNTGRQGGAMSLWYSYLYLKQHSELYISNNYAQDRGGGIFFSNTIPLYDSWDSTKIKCIAQTIEFSPQFRLHFVKNIANNSGDDIYGGRIKTKCIQSDRPTSAAVDIQKFFDFKSKSLSSVSSDPTRVCLCSKDGTPQCSDINYIYASVGPFFPGEMFSVHLVLVGNDFGTNKGVVYTKIVSDYQFTSLGPQQSTQVISEHRKCSELELSLQSSSVNEIHSVQISAMDQAASFTQMEVSDSIFDYLTNNESISYNLLHIPVILKVSLEECPIGMQLSQHPPYVCKCHPRLEAAGIMLCVISNHTGIVYRSQTMWVGTYSVANKTELFVHKFCPYNLCLSQNISVDPSSPDSQCTFNRSGLLCGSCQEGFSVAIGSMKCLECDNSHASLILFFCAAGILLVVFIKVLDVTVAKGTINGLIFYSNVIWSTRSIYINDDNSLAQILHVFLAWLNLDFGIETCFFDGLDTYWKTWLQFAFPLYIWSLTGIIIISSHYSTRASKLFGNNSVPVLATLILLSYTKLLRTIIDSLNFTILEYEHGQITVWTLDGNYPYFGNAHIILFLVVIVVLLLVWLPFTVVLFSVQWLRRKSNIRPLRWINKFKPLFDAYFGQLKPACHYWVGLLLLVRIVLLVVYTSTSAFMPTVNIALMIAVSMLLVLMQVYIGSVYKSTALSILENSFIVNLGIVGTITLFLNTIGRSNAPTMHVSISLALLKFLAIVVYHLVSSVKARYSTWKRRQDQNPGNLTTRPTPRVTHQMHYREPLLENSNSHE